jgi:hypothetical protein
MEGFMSFKRNENQQLSFSDRYMSQSDRTKRYLEKSWALRFAEEIFPRINEERFRVLYSEHQFSRPNTPINVIISALILKEMNQLTDDELLESILFDVRYQYALHTTSFEEQPFSDRTVSRFRARLLKYEQETGIDLLKEEMLALADAFVEHLGMDTRKKRMDSLMVATNCRRMGTLDLLYSCVAQVVKQSTKQGLELGGGFEKYLDENNRKNMLYRVKSDEVPGLLAALLEDGYRLLQEFPPEAQREVEAYKNLKRCLEEQTREAEGKYEMRDPQEVSASSLQTPYDPDATYRVKAGTGHRGYVGNVVETVDKTEDTTRAMITDFDYQKNTYSDIQFCKDVLEKMGRQEERVQLVVDGAYSGIQNIEAAEAQNIELITGTMNGGMPNPHYAEFEVDEKAEEITRCPAGKAPLTSQLMCKGSKNRHSRRYRITFETSVCENCSHNCRCRVEFLKTKAAVVVQESAIKRAKYAKKMGTEEYRELICFRAGVEGIPSVLRRKYKVDTIPDRGYLRSKLWFTVKIGAINAARLIVLCTKGHLLGDLLKNFYKIFSIPFFRTTSYEIGPF